MDRHGLARIFDAGGNAQTFAVAQRVVELPVTGSAGGYSGSWLPLDIFYSSRTRQYEQDRLIWSLHQTMPG